MSKQYAAFLLRWWRRADGVQRITIEHIQSHARTVVGSGTAAVDWLEARLAANCGDEDAALEKHPRSIDEYKDAARSRD